ncbi:mitogen-activated protein kinase kinase kinase NPK1-like [Arachis ipaensis]|uniref:mitogen-activated protein kinase kinase kinase NPK1-like n=1 Tax=Arachis ipaensis TaxID=130454 RepID=UPI0007AF8622|nr:mitogen-activated protein kinase kinase kinase NPK1-like [Arachis ipaensis]XP_029149759.1 mitogen-activated protein kinase kinase kinase 17-like [Arachis hypogaea]
MSDLQWKKVEVLGAGSYGTVSLAILVDEQNRFHSFIAVKSSIPRLAFSLEKEEQIFKSLWEGESGGCQEIIECFGTEITVEHGHQFYNLFLEYAPYGSLADLIHKKPLPETEVSVYARMIVKGLSHIHRKGIVHCDLKPENILVFPSLDKEIANYQLKIADFGLSKTKEEKADVELWKSKPRGTPSYLSPEAFSGHIDAPMDIWALGCIVIEMLTGLPAWGESPLLIEELRYLVEHHELSPRKPQGIGFFCHDFLEKCFTKDPSKRWTADRVLDHPFLYITHNDQQPQHSLAIPEDDLGVKRVRDLKKRKREEPVASGTLRIWNLEFIEEEDEEGEGAVEKRVWEWRKRLVEKMNGIELNLEGVKFKLDVSVPVSDDFEAMKKDWEQNLNVAEDDDPGKVANEDSGDLVSGLYCKIVVQFEKYRDFHDALRVLCGRSLQKVLACF